MKASIVIPHYNRRDILCNCLKSLIQQQFQDFEIVIVDNASTDDSVEYVNKHFPETKVIQLPFKMGFSSAVNTGIKVSSGEYIALLNNDTEVHHDWLSELVKAVDSLPETSFCTSKILYFKRRNLIDSLGDSYNTAGLAKQIGHGEEITNYKLQIIKKIQNLKFKTQNMTQSTKSTEAQNLSIVDSLSSIDSKSSTINQPLIEVFGACGAAAIYRRSMFDVVGLFDENIFAYYEDVELSFRARLMGYRCFYVPTALVYHLSPETRERGLKIGKETVYIHLTGILLKNMPDTLILKNIIPIFIVHFAIVTGSVFVHFVSTMKKKKAETRPVPTWSLPYNKSKDVKFYSNFSPFKFLLSMYKQRSNIQTKRKITNKELEKMLEHFSIIESLKLVFSMLGRFVSNLF